MKNRIITLASSALAAALILTGCSTSPANNATAESPSPTAPSVVAANFNNADETFVMGMIAHHEQAIEMADMLLDKDGVDERVTSLAVEIKDAQGPELDTMNSWLDAWGIMGADSGMEGMDHSGGMMMSDDDMAALENASGIDASKLFLVQMTEHHQGAIDMAQQQLDNGENPDALSLAQKIIDDQTAEIATMKRILEAL